MLCESKYRFDSRSGVWHRLQSNDRFSYSDGDDAEEAILRAIIAAKDRTSGSDELVSKITDWPTEYHFSSARSNLLIPFQSRFQGASVLEIGSGCGALTRFLGEAGARVVAIEGSPRRARITAARCEGLPNVTVVCDNFRDLSATTRFDCVIAIGVLEYAPRFFEGPSPVNSFLMKMADLLRPSGAIVLAIENQLGLKYFSGCTEDHSRELFFGIEDRYWEHQSTITFGRGELSRIITDAGFLRANFLYPFPDYKLPGIVFSEEGIHDPDFGAGRIIGDYPARDYSRPRLSLFVEETAWEVIQRNSLIEDFANSFMVIASKELQSPWARPVGWLAKSFSSYRLKKYRTVTTFTRDDRVIKIRKERLHPEPADDTGARIRLLVPSESVFVPGSSLKHVLVKQLLNPGTTLDDLVSILEPWAKLIRANALADGRVPSAMLPGRFIDCVPWNLTPDPNDPSSLTYFDSEWEWDTPIRRELPFVRGLVLMKLPLVNVPWMANLSLADLIMELAGRMDLPISAGELDRMLETSAEFARLVMPVDGESLKLHFKDAVRHPYGDTGNATRFIEEHERAKQEIATLRIQLSALRDSRIWRLTAPGRRVLDFAKQLVSRILG